MTEMVQRGAVSEQEAQAIARNRVVVLGMHRSGTSACTAALHSMGAHVGGEDELTGRSAENPVGFFERRDIRKVCDALLAAAAADWWKVAAFKPSLIPEEAAGKQARTLGAILSRLDAKGVWAIKEPRLCLLVPVLRDVLGDAVFVHIVRDPVEVAKSLRHRNGFTMQAGLALWEAYNAAVLRNTAGRPRLVLAYDELVADPAAVLGRLQADLAALGIALDNADAAVIAPELHRQHAAPSEQRALLTEAQARLWEHLRDGGGDAAFAVSNEALRVLREFEEDQAVLIGLKRRNAALETAAKGARVPGDETPDYAAAAKKLVRLEGTLTALAEEGVAKRDAELAESRTALAAAARQNAKLAEANAVLMQQLAQATAMSAYDGRAGAGRFELAMRVIARRDARWRRLLEKRDDLIDRLSRRLDKANADFDRLVRATRKAAEIGPLTRLRARVGSAVRTGDANPPATVHAVLANSEAKRLVARSKEQKTALPDTTRDVGRLPATIGISTRPVGRVAFVTAIAGGYDPVLDPSVVDLSADYVLFTDDPATRSDVWTTRSFDYVDADPTRTARYVKTHPHVYFPDYDRVIWVDANLRIDCLAEDLIPAEEEDADIITWRHPLRDCVYVEAEECILRAKDDELTIREHVKTLRGMGYPENNGLIESSVVAVSLRRSGVAAFLADWWRLIDNGSRRDQISFNPALSLHPAIRVGFLGEKGVEMRTDRRFTYRHHPFYGRRRAAMKGAESR